MNRQYRKTVIAGNWKMNMDPAQTRAFAGELLPQLGDCGRCDIVVCPPALSIPAALESFAGSCVMVGAQNVHHEPSGAFTGEISVPMLVSAGVKYVIIGHSERRRDFAESDSAVNLKARAAVEAEVIPIICVGESLEQRELGITDEHVSMQVKAALAGLPAALAERVVIAYEPIWAIGTGRTATPEQAQEVCGLIRGVLSGLYGEQTAQSVSILYGGSMNAKNARELLSQPDIDGGLIGGASLKSEDFKKIIDAADLI